MVSLTDLHLRAVRARIAATGLPPPVAPDLGAVQLRADQCASVGRVIEALERDGGCVLADDVGLGKTFVALAVARRWTHPLVVVPASLRSTWRMAMVRAGVSMRMVSHETLSRSVFAGEQPDGVIVDESHRFRSTSAKRYASLARLTMRARLLLLSATPLQNRARDLAAQVALFRGASAFRLDARALAAFVVRGAGDLEIGLPLVGAPKWVRPAVDDGDVLDAILGLPAPPRPADGGDAGLLRTIGLIRAWASSRGALLHAVRRRQRAAAAIEQSASAGLLPTKRELRAWNGEACAIQLGFAPLLVAQSVGGSQALSLLDSISSERTALARLVRVMTTSADPDDARAQEVRAICAAHPGERVLAFAELATTARTLYSRLRGMPGVGLLTARESRVASGKVPRDVLLGWFAPRGRGVPEPPVRERVTLLVATDLLSEGVNLQDASVVIHADLPWNPARLSQRVGRVRRPGGVAVIHTYLMAPPARAELLLDVEQRLRTKIAEAAQAIGRGIDVVPHLASPPSSREKSEGWATRRGEVVANLLRWSTRPRPRGPRIAVGPMVAAVDGGTVAWLAALGDGRLVASVGGRGPDSGESVARVVRLCSGEARVPTPVEVCAARSSCERWQRVDQLAYGCGLDNPPDALRVELLRRIAIVLRRAPGHLRPSLAILATRLHAELAAPRPLGLEWALRTHLANGTTDDLTWLADASALLSSEVRTPDARGNAPSIVALLLVGRTEI